MVDVHWYTLSQFCKTFISRSPSPPAKKQKTDTDKSDPVISNVLQGEIARLNHRFKVNLDPLFHTGSKTVHLICKLGKVEFQFVWYERCYDILLSNRSFSLHLIEGSQFAEKKTPENNCNLPYIHVHVGVPCTLCIIYMYVYTHVFYMYTGK